MKTVLLLGPHCNDSEVLLGNYHGIPSHTVTIFEGISDRAAAAGVKLLYSPGVAIEGDGLWMLEDAVQASTFAELLCAVDSERGSTTVL